MFKREVSGSLRVDLVAYEVGGKVKAASKAASMMSMSALAQLDQWSLECHCAQQPLQKGIKDMEFHFCDYNTVVDVLVHRKTARFAKKSYVGRCSLPLFTLRRVTETLALDLQDVPSDLDITEGPIRIWLRVSLRPVRYTVNDFEFVASVSHGSSMAGSEMLFVRDRDTKKPYFMKILNNGGPEWSHVAADEDASSGAGDSGDVGVEEDTFTIAAEGGAGGGQRVLALPSHPFVVDVFTWFRKGQSHYLLMEWVEGGQLFSTAKRTAEGRFSEEQTRFFVGEAVLALEHLHLHGVVYGDLKPENLLLDRKGHVKLTRPTPGPQALLERYNEFLAPELLGDSDGDKALAAALACKADWWSLGCIVYMLLVGVAPFSHPSVTVTTARILSADYQLPRGKQALSPAAEDLLRGLLCKSVKKRMDVRAIKRHAFFQGLDWSKLSRRELKPQARPFRRWHTQPTRRDSDRELGDSCSTSESTTSTTLSELLSARA